MDDPDVPAAEELVSVLDPAGWTVDAGPHAAPHPAGRTHDVVLHAVERPDRPPTPPVTSFSDRTSRSYWSLDEARWVHPV